jgi:hypothetical protein
MIICHNFFAFSKFSIEYHLRFEKCLTHLILYCSLLLIDLFVNRESMMIFTSNFCSSSITTNDDEEMICLDKEFSKSFFNNEIWNIEWMFISSDNFNLYELSLFFRILNDSSILWSSFLNDRSIGIFLIDSHTVVRRRYRVTGWSGERDFR